LLVLPLLQDVQRVYPVPADLEARCLTLLDYLRGQDPMMQGYGPANLVTLLRVLRGDLRSLDLSRLTLRGVFLQGIDMQNAMLSEAVIQNSVFTETFDDILAVTISSTGAYWATASRRGELRVWEGDGQTLRHAWRAHTDMVWSLRFSPDERTLASGNSGGSVKLWDVTRGTLLWSDWLTKSITVLAFSPMGNCSPVRDLVQPSGSGIPGAAYPSRSCRIPVQSSRWRGARMGNSSPAVTSGDRFGSGKCSRPGPLAACGRSKDIRNG
jgi:hypothetical protein